MARIAFFTERLPPDADPVSEFAFELMKSLADQQHEVLISSTYRQGDSIPQMLPRMELIRPFRHWSWLEIPRLIPVLMQFRPEILHLIQPRSEALSGFTNAMTALPALSAVLGAGRGRVQVVSSIYDLRSKDLKYHRPLLAASDAVTVPNEPQRSLIEGFLGSLRRAPPVFVLPVSAGSVAPLISFGDEVKETQEPSLEFLARSLDFAYVPGDLSDHPDLDRLFTELISVLDSQPEAHIVFGGGWGQVPMRTRHTLMRRLNVSRVDHRVLLTGTISAETERACLTKAKAVFTASLPAESLEVARILRGALEASALLVMSEGQSSVDPLAWRDGENALIARSAAGDWSRRLCDAFTSGELGVRIRQRLPEFARLEAVDLPGNVMSRIYAQVLGQAALRDRRRAGRNTRL